MLGTARFRMLSLLSLILLLGLGAVVVRASGLFTAVQDPERLARPVAPIPLLAPPSSEGYEQLPADVVDTPISAPDDRPVAYLAQPPSGLAQSLAVNFPNTDDWSSSDSVEFFVLASVRYSGSGHIILVTTARPSPEAARESWVLGDETIQLADGSLAWISTDKPGETPNRLVIVKDDLIITVASDLPIETIQELASQIVVKQGR
ncbi:MAG TPA: hypothetical protein ENN99_06185 [Chloroflexi bacterium]|nr:hypothetical protein [Chloroflexota bacterium]